MKFLIKNFLLEFLSSGKPRSFYLHLNSTICLYLPPKSVQYFLALGEHFGSKPPLVEPTALSHTPKLLKVHAKFSRINSEEIIWTLFWVLQAYCLVVHASCFTHLQCNTCCNCIGCVIVIVFIYYLGSLVNKTVSPLILRNHG